MTYEGLMSDVLFVAITLAAFVGLALVVTALDSTRQGRDDR